MKTRARLLVLMAFFGGLFCQKNNAQSTTHFSKSGPGWWTLGIDGGWAYQSADVRALSAKGWGGGLTLGKNLLYRQGAPFSFDLRGRGLLDRSFGADHRRSFGILKNESLNGSKTSRPDFLIDQDATLDSSFVFANYRTTMAELGLEGALTFNRLRERTGLVLTLFGGIGLDFWHSDYDHQVLGQNYDYSKISTTGSRRQILADLSALRDGDFETTADGIGLGIGVGLMPGAGLEIGYQVAPRFVIGVGHKLTFPRHDRLDGQQWTNENTATAQNDIAHYTNIHLRWDLGGSKKKRNDPPEITFEDPRQNPFSAERPDLFVRARVENVASQADVSARLNGQNVSFRFSNEKFGANIRLRPGRNELEIEAHNLDGSDRETLVINYVYESPAPPPAPPVRNCPEVNFSSPARSPLTTEKSEIFVSAIVKNVRSNREIRFFVNGIEETRFSMAENFEANVRLREGRNVLKITAFSDGCREASDEVVINFEPKKVEPPTEKVRIEITDPSRETTTTEDESYYIKAQTAGVASRSELSMTIDGRSFSAFEFDSRQKVLTANVPLEKGENRIRVRASNRSGSDEDAVTITRNEKIRLPKKPVVEIIEPTNGKTFDEKFIALRAEVRNVDGRDQISVRLNGQPQNGFDFDQKSSQIRISRLELRDGANTIGVRATNSDGSDEATVTVYFDKIKSVPTVEWTDPRSQNSTATEKTRLVKAQTSKVSDASQIEFLVNGQRKTAFNFNARNGEFSASVDLRDGDNALIIKVLTSEGRAEDAATIRLEGTKKLPTVEWTDPRANTNSSVSSRRVEAKMTNVSDASQLEFLVNGLKKTGFNFNARDGQFSATVDLRDGDNSLIIKALTPDGRAEAMVSIKFEKPKNLPTVSILTPREGTRFEKNEVDVEADVTNVSRLGRGSATFFVNGKSTSGGSLEGGKWRGRATLEEGQNTLELKVTNADGTASDAVKVFYETKKTLPAPPPVIEPVAKPTVQFLTPKRPGIVVEKADFEIKFSTKNVASTRELTLKLNGKAASIGRFDPKTGEGTAKIKLADGRNLIDLVAKNEGGTATASTKISLGKSVEKPTITVISVSQPVASPMNPTVARSTVLADFKNITSRDQITVKHNGEVFSSFEFDEKTGRLKAVITLKTGQNTIVLRAENAGGEAVETRTVNF